MKVLVEWDEDMGYIDIEDKRYYLALSERIVLNNGKEYQIDHMVWEPFATYVILKEVESERND